MLQIVSSPVKATTLFSQIRKIVARARKLLLLAYKMSRDLRISLYYIASFDNNIWNGGI